MTTDAPAARNARKRDGANAAAFDPVEFRALSEMIGENGVREIVEIFATETRRRLHRLTAGGQNLNALVREMHTLKGAAGTVAAPRLALLGCTFEQAAQRGIGPSADDLKAIDTALEAFLAAARTWSRRCPLSR